MNEANGVPLNKRMRWAIATTMIAVPAVYLVLARGTETARANVPVASAAQLAQASTAQGANPLQTSLAYINGGTPGKAVPLLKAMLADDPKEVRAWNNLCVAYMGLQEFNHAMSACESGVAVDPGMQLLQNNLKWAQDEAAKARAIVTAETSRPRATRSAESYLLEGLNRLHLGEYGEAQTAWYQCLAIEPKNALAENNIGVAFMMLGKPGEAVTAFQKAMALDTGSQLYRNNLAWAQSTM